MTIKIQAASRLRAAEVKKTFTFILKGDGKSREVDVDALNEVGAWVGVVLWHKEAFEGVKSVTLKG